MALTTTQRAEIKRMLGYPNLGAAASVTLGYPSYASPMAQWQPYQWLERRLTEMSSDEEVAILGTESTLFAAYFTPASLALTLSTPTAIVAGVTLQLDIDSETVTTTTQAGDTPGIVAARAASAVMADTNAAAAAFAAPSGATISFGAVAIGALGNGVVIQAYSSDPSLLLSLGAPAAQFVVGVTAGGANPPGPTLLPQGSEQQLYGYVPIIRLLERDLGGARENLDQTKIEGLVNRADEMQARAALLGRYRRELADRLSVPLDPDIVGNRRGRMLRRV